MKIGAYETEKDIHISTTLLAFKEYISKNTIFMSGEAEEDIIKITMNQLKLIGTKKWKGYTAFKKLKRKYNCGI